MAYKQFICNYYYNYYCYYCSIVVNIFISISHGDLECISSKTAEWIWWNFARDSGLFVPEIASRSVVEISL